LTLVADGVNPTTGAVDVYITALPTDLIPPVIVSSFQASVVASNLSGISAVTFGTPTDPVNQTDLFPTTPVLTPPSPPGQAWGTSSFLAPPAQLFDQAGLMSVPFSVPAGETGTFDLVFLQTGGLPTSLYDTSFVQIPTGYSSGMVTINAVPEPSSMALGALGIVGVALVGWRRRRRAKAS
jgi:hypothetical protein